MNKKLIIYLVIGLIVLILIIALNLNKKQNTNSNELETNKNYSHKEQVTEIIKEEKIEMIKITVNNNVLEVKLEDNEATKSLIERLKNRDIKVKANEYGGFEKVGNLGLSLPRNDMSITTSAGDIVLYQGNQISIFYNSNSNSWNYTRLGKIQNISESELKTILGTEDVEMTLSLN